MYLKMKIKWMFITEKYKISYLVSKKFSKNKY